MPFIFSVLDSMAQDSVTLGSESLVLEFCDPRAFVSSSVILSFAICSDGVCDSTGLILGQIILNSGLYYYFENCIMFIHLQAQRQVLGKRSRSLHSTLTPSSFEGYCLLPTKDNWSKETPSLSLSTLFTVLPIPIFARQNISIYPRPCPFLSNGWPG